MDPSCAILLEIQALLEQKANGQYGLTLINQQQHALQGAWLAEQEGHDDAMIVAALLHDIGHMVHDFGDEPADKGIDDRHEELGHEWLKSYFGPEVTEPIRLHVAAKRYLCAIEPDYFAKLSADSVKSLALQGGPMSPKEVQAFESLPHYRQAVQLRRYDERAKVKGLVTPSVAYFMPVVSRCLNSMGVR